MLKVFTYEELPDKTQRLIIEENEKIAKLKLLRRGVRFRKFGIEPVRTLRLVLTKNLFTDKEQVAVLRTVERYLRNKRSVLEALKTASYSPDPNVSLLATTLYERVLSGQDFGTACEGLFPDYVVTVLKSARREGQSALSLQEVLNFVIDFMESERKTKKKIKPVLMTLKVQLVVAVVGFLAVLTFAVPRLYKLSKALNPYKKYSSFMEKIIAAGNYLSNHKAVAVVLGVVLVLLVIRTLTEEKTFSALNKIPKLRIAEVLDKKLIASYTLLFTRLSIPPYQAIKRLIDVPKLPSTKEKLKKAYHKLYARTEISWGEFFEVANVDKLLTVKTKTSGADLEDELETLVSDYDELTNEQIERTSQFVNLLGMGLVAGFVVFFAYVVFTLLYG